MVQESQQATIYRVRLDAARGWCSGMTSKTSSFSGYPAGPKIALVVCEQLASNIWTMMVDARIAEAKHNVNRMVRPAVFSIPNPEKVE